MNVNRIFYLIRATLTGILGCANQSERGKPQVKRHLSMAVFRGEAASVAQAVGS